MLQDLVLVVASAFLAPVIGVALVVTIRKIRQSLALRAEERALSQGPEEQPARRSAASAALAKSEAIVDAGGHDAPGPASIDQPEIVIIGGQPIEWGPTMKPPEPSALFDPAELGRPAPAWPGRVRNGGVALLAVAVVGVASITISSNLASAIPSGAVLGATNGVPSSVPGPGASTPGTTRSEEPGVSAAAVAALRGTAVVNDRIAVDADVLASELARKDVRAVDLARRLRSLVSGADLGSVLAGQLAPWSGADPLRSDLTSFYESVSATARDGLRAPLNDLAAYRSAAASMLEVVAGLAAIDAASRDLAASVPVELPPISVPLPE